VVERLDNLVSNLDTVIKNGVRKCALDMEKTLMDLMEEDIATFVLNQDGAEEKEPGISTEGSFLKSSSIIFSATKRKFKWNLTAVRNIAGSGLSRLTTAFIRHYHLDANLRRLMSEKKQHGDDQQGGGNKRKKATPKIAVTPQQEEEKVAGDVGARLTGPSVFSTSIFFRQEDLNLPYHDPTLTTYGFLYSGGRKLSELVAEALLEARNNIPLVACSSSDFPTTASGQDDLLLSESIKDLLQNHMPLSCAIVPSLPPRRIDYMNLIQNQEADQAIAAATEILELTEYVIYLQVLSKLRGAETVPVIFNRWYVIRN